jgi:hypothetical protein
MLQNLLRRQSPALAVAIIALVAALAGSATATVFKVRSSKEIKDGAIQLRDLSPSARKALTGTAGLSGARGADGAHGPKGDTGARGERGADGANGLNGTNGTDGRDAFTDVGTVALASMRGGFGTTWSDVIGASTTVTVPAGRTATVSAVLSAESLCNNGTAGDRCLVQILIDGQGMVPNGNSSPLFDISDGTDTASWDMTSLVRSATAVGPGTHTVKVQASVTKAGADAPGFSLNDLSVVVHAVDEG